jgi:drug/metabolite transporter (DMT)-like permease
MDMKGNTKYYASLVVVTFFWGVTWVSAKVLLSYIPPLTVGFLRYTIALPLFFVLLKFRGISFQQIFQKNVTRILIIAGVSGIFLSVFIRVYALQYTTASQASIIAGFSPVGVSIFAYVMHKEKLVRNWDYIGFIVCFIGVIFVIGVQSLLEFNLNYLVGNLLALIASIFWSYFSSISKSAMQKLSPIEVIFGCMFVGWLCFGISVLPEINVLTNIIVTPEFLFHLFFIGICPSFIGYILYFSSIDKIGATRTGAFISLVPIFGTLMSALLLQEVIYWTFIVGLFLVVAGILVINSPFSKKEKSELLSPG